MRIKQYWHPDCKICHSDLAHSVLILPRIWVIRSYRKYFIDFNWVSSTECLRKSEMNKCEGTIGLIKFCSKREELYNKKSLSSRLLH